MKPDDLDRAEILMFLNTPELDDNLSAMLDACTEKLCAAAQPRTIYRVLPVEHGEAGVTLGGLPLQGQDIALHLTGCKEAVLLAVTLSAPVDALIRRASVTDMTQAVMYDAIAGAAVERVCNDLEAEIRAKYPYPYYTARFSAGYGDFPITQQGALVRLLDATRKIGLTVTPAQTLVPMKSVTAVIGMSHEPVRDARRFGCGNSCAECPYNESCPMAGRADSR
ncbi:MAG: hypothetical protein IKG82_13935 [Oscillospiraceae bacterium]|nr:hypothetical protein [Oscillospiraceae bacterium]MBR3419783.1 hypothetical protein [Oscillospiraceae bacterium]